MEHLKKSLAQENKSSLRSAHETLQMAIISEIILKPNSGMHKRRSSDAGIIDLKWSAQCGCEG